MKFPGLYLLSLASYIYLFHIDVLFVNSFLWSPFILLPNSSFYFPTLGAPSLSLPFISSLPALSTINAPTPAHFGTANNILCFLSLSLNSLLLLSFFQSLALCVTRALYYIDSTARIKLFRDILSLAIDALFNWSLTAFVKYHVSGSSLVFEFNIRNILPTCLWFYTPSRYLPCLIHDNQQLQIVYLIISMFPGTIWLFFTFHSVPVLIEQERFCDRSCVSSKYLLLKNRTNFINLV